MITYLLDRIRIRLGDSQCPLYNRCQGADNEFDCCVSFRGRDEIGGERTKCYKLFKPQIRKEKQGIFSGLASKFAQGILHVGGLED